MSKLSSHFFSDFVDNTYLHIFLLVVVVQIVVNHATRPRISCILRMRV
ncbi:hypothetical protein BN188_1360025 [Clostridioides difficile T19]|nr:hypothetical protein BN188_1360025 [Clostridioides difficile T19]